MNRTAFSLVELSIVLVILGLLTGGILAGQSLIHAAELRSVSTGAQRYAAAINAFRDKYFFLPGDMNNAVAFWGQAATCPGDSTHIGTGTQTCNGDGDGIIAAAGADANSDENFRSWQHLANAGLIEGSYNGVDMGTNHYTATSANTPTGRIASSLWMLESWGSRTGNGNFFDGVYNNMLLLGLATASTDPQPLLTPPDMWNIDTKMDDGKPGTGRVYGRFWGTCTNAASGTNYSADYVLTSATAGCEFMLRLFN